ncbi:MAG: AzlD domain-containing protein [Euzebyales bacterium]|jgi:branched-subunit amino acid transport protein|nr:AzlD domain-containing protein [Euzebyales bacterium]
MIVGAGLATIALKAAGPLLLGGRQMSPRVTRLLDLLGPALLAALVVTATLARDGAVVADARLAGVAAAAIALALRAPLLVAVVIAALVAAGLRALGVG